MKVHETTERSIVKTVTYRFILIVSSFAIIFFFTGNPRETVEITLVSNGVAMVLYFLHERFWNKVHWGKVVRK